MSQTCSLCEQLIPGGHIARGAAIFTMGGWYCKQCCLDGAVSTALSAIAPDGSPIEDLAPTPQEAFDELPALESEPEDGAEAASEALREAHGAELEELRTAHAAELEALRSSEQQLRGDLRERLRAELQQAQESLAELKALEPSARAAEEAARILAERSQEGGASSAQAADGDSLVERVQRLMEDEARLRTSLENAESGLAAIDLDAERTAVRASLESQHAEELEALGERHRSELEAETTRLRDALARERAEELGRLEEAHALEVRAATIRSGEEGEEGLRRALATAEQQQEELADALTHWEAVADTGAASRSDASLTQRVTALLANRAPLTGGNAVRTAAPPADDGSAMRNQPMKEPSSHEESTPYSPWYSATRGLALLEGLAGRLPAKAGAAGIARKGLEASVRWLGKLVHSGHWLTSRIGTREFFLGSFRILYAIVAVSSLAIIPLTLFGFIAESDRPKEYITNAVLWLPLSVTALLHAVLWKNRAGALGRLTNPGERYVAIPLYAHLIRTLGEAVGLITWLGGISYGLLTEVIIWTPLVTRRDATNLIDSVLPGTVPFMIACGLAGYIAMLLTRTAAEALDALPTVANNTQRIP